MERKVLKILFVILLMLSPFFGFSQGEFNQWRFGVNAGLDFNFSPPVSVSGSVMSTAWSTVSISDSIGNLLFYSHGSAVWNKNNLSMQNGTGLYGGWQIQTVYSVNDLGNDSIYFLFTIGPWDFFPTMKGLFYSKIDMRLDGGLGGIIPGIKNISVPGTENACCSMHGTRHRNNRDVWLVLRIENPQSYHSYLVTPSGLNSIPVISPSIENNPLIGNNPGTNSTKISQDGAKLTTVYNSDTIAEFCNYNNSSGVVTPLFTFITRYRGGKYVNLTCEFSQDSKYLYIGSVGGDYLPPDFPVSLLFQYDATLIDSAQFMQSEILIDSSFMFGLYEGLQLASDGKIYCGNYIKDSVSVINNPNIQGSGCNFQKNAIWLNGHNCAYGLPQFLQKYKAYLHHTGNCQLDSVHFSGDIWPPADSILWNFGDPASGAANYSAFVNPSHSYSSPGDYTVELYVRHNDTRTDTTWQTINILASPQPAIGPDRTICASNSTTFDAGACNGCTYLWKDVNSGLTVGTTQTLTTSQAGIYMVTMTNSTGCIGKDTIQLFTTPEPQVTNNPLSITICSGESTNIPLTSNATGTMFHWTATLTSGLVTGFSADSGLVINQSLLNAGTTAGIVTYHITPKVGECTGISVDFPVTVNVGDPVNVSITASFNNICAGTPVTFIATPTNPGTTPVYQWNVNAINAGFNNAGYTYVPGNGDIVQCFLTSSNTVCTSNNPATSNSITMVVNPNLPVNISVSPSANPVCSGTPVTYTASPVNGGTTPFYQWTVNGINAITNNPVFTYSPVNGDVVICSLLSSETCTSGNPSQSNQITMGVSANLPAGVTITASSNPFCSGSAVTFTASPVNGGSSASFQWKVNGINAGTNSSIFTYNPAPNDSVRCIMTSNLSCVNGNPVSSAKIIMNGSLAPNVSFTSCFDTITTINAKPFKLKGGLPLGGTYSGPGVNSTTGIFTPSIAGTGLKTIDYTYSNIHVCSASKSKSIQVQPDASFTCGNNLIDPRDNKVYPTVQFGTQCWMGKNLDFGLTIPDLIYQTDNCLAEKYCYNGSASNCNPYGGLYQWDELMKYQTAEGSQGLCPPGWHVPTEIEWITLFNYYQGNSLAGRPLQDSIINGFNAQKSGVFYSNSSWNFMGFATLFWSSTSLGQLKALSYGMNSWNFSVSLYPSSRANSFSVRCTRDN